MPTYTTRLNLQQPVGVDAVSEQRTAITANAATLDAAALYQSGALAARPAAGSTTAGTLYYATDTSALYLLVAGGAWQQVTLGSGIASAVRNAAGGSALQVQTGSLSQPIAASVTTPFNVPLTQPWPNAHVLFDVAGLQYTSTVAGTQLIQWGPYDTGGTAQLNKGSVTITNGGIAQNVVVWWLSLGY